LSTERIDIYGGKATIKQNKFGVWQILPTVQLLMIEFLRNNADIYSLMTKFGFRAYDKKLSQIITGGCPSGDIFFVNERFVK